MTDKPEDRPEERRRTGPLGDNAGSEPTRQEPPADTGSGPTRPVPTGQPPEGEEGSARETERIPQRPAGPPPGETEDKETRVIRTPPYDGTQGEASAYPRGYFEAADEREDRLRDMYGGVDWLASFLGFVFAIVAGALFSAVAGLVLAPLGLSLSFEAGEIGAAAITGLVLVAILVFLTYFFGGYVSGRLARFDGGRNGAMLLLWTGVAVLILALVSALLSGFLPVGISDNIDNFIQNNLLATIGGLSGLGVVGIIILVGAILAALLGGFLGGRLGSRYHAEIDRTT